jgi:hypothetical protein
MRFLGRVLIVGLAGLVLASCERAVQLPYKEVDYASREAPPESSTGLGRRIFSVIGEEIGVASQTVPRVQNQGVESYGSSSMLSPYGVTIGVYWRNWEFTAWENNGTEFRTDFEPGLSQDSLFKLLGLKKEDWKSEPGESDSFFSSGESTLYRWNRYRIQIFGPPSSVYRMHIWYEYPEPGAFFK